MINLTAHEPGSPLPCLCKACIANAPTHASTDGLEFRRITATTQKRELHAWLPTSLEAEAPLLLKSMVQRLELRNRRSTGRLSPLRADPVVRPDEPEVEPTPAPGFWSRVRKLFS